MSKDNDSTHSGSDSSDDNAQLSQFYQSTKKAEPSSSIDDAVLAMAKKQAAKNSDSQPSPLQKPKRPWLHWQYGGSIAASVLLVSFVYLYSVTPQAPETVLQVPNAAAPVASLSADAGVQVAEPIVRQRASAREFAMESDEFKVSPSAARLNAAPEQAIESEIAIDELVASRGMRDMLNEAQQSAVEEDAEDDVKALYEQLIALISVTKGQMSVKQSDSDSQRLVQTSEQQIQALQSQLFERLSEQKSARNDWTLMQKYQRVLTEAQAEALLEPKNKATNNAKPKQN